MWCIFISLILSRCISNNLLPIELPNLHAYPSYVDVQSHVGVEVPTKTTITAAYAATAIRWSALLEAVANPKNNENNTTATQTVTSFQVLVSRNWSSIIGPRRKGAPTNVPTIVRLIMSLQERSLNSIWILPLKVRNHPSAASAGS